MITTNRIDDYLGADYKEDGDIRPTIENEERYTIPRPTDPATTSTTTANDFNNLVFKI